VRKHVVRDGDTWWNLAKLYSVSLPELMLVNPHIPKTYPLPIQETLTIPDPERIKLLKFEGKEDNQADPESSDSTDGSDTNKTKEILEQTDETQNVVFTPFPVVNKLADPKFSKAGVWGELGSYVCHSGDTWEGIAERFYITVDHLKAANPHLKHLTWLQPGQQINIPSIGMTLYEQMKNKQQKQIIQNPQTYSQPANPYMNDPSQFYVSSKDWITSPYPFYRCICRDCLRSQTPIPLDELESESLARANESSSFWGSSSYFDSSSLINESSSSWLTESR
jgi:LysM repeat protein